MDNHQQWAGAGTPALSLVEGPIGWVFNGLSIMGGGYTALEGYGTFSDGQYGAGASLLGLGTLEMLGGRAGMRMTMGGGAMGMGSAADNIYSSMTPMEQMFPELRGINPHYVEDATAGVNTNCVSCANAVQQRLTGQNPSAVANPSNGYATENALLPSAPMGFGSLTTPSAVVDEMLQAGDGTTRPLLIKQEGNVQHVINVVNRDGQIYFIDAQMGKIVTLQPNISVRLGRPWP